jgi:hypothetical protein
MVCSSGNLIDNEKLARYKLLKTVDCCCIDIEAVKAAYLLRIYRNTINCYYSLFRHLIHGQQMAEMDKFVAVNQIDNTSSARNASLVALGLENWAGVHPGSPFSASMSTTGAFILKLKVIVLPNTY